MSCSSDAPSEPSVQVQPVVPGDWREMPIHENRYLSGNFAPVSAEVTATGLHVEGVIPKELSGLFVRNGPNPMFTPGEGYHWFEGDGMLHGVVLDNGAASYCNRVVKTEHLALELKAQRRIFRSTLGLEKKRISAVMSAFNNIRQSGDYAKKTANTALLHHHRKLLALLEISLPVEMSVPDLDTIGPYNFGGQWTGSFTAHPKVDPETGELLAFGYGMDPTVQYSVFDSSGSLKHHTTFPLPSSVMMHDFAITPNYSIFLDLPYSITLSHVLKTGSMSYDPHGRARIGVLGRYEAGDKIRWFDIEPCYIFHVGNAYEEGDEIVLQVCRYPSMRLNYLRSLNDPDVAAHLYEYRINLKSNSVSLTNLVSTWGLDTSIYWSEFPRVPDGLLGRPARYMYVGRIIPRLTKVAAIDKYDLEKKKVSSIVFGPGRYGGEPVFVPRDTNSSEDDGWLLTYVHDEILNQSELLILDAKDLSQPQARVLLPQRVPYGFHGLWVDSKAFPRGKA